MVLCVPVALALNACQPRTAQEAGRCLHHHQGTFGNYTQWGPCPGTGEPWNEGGR
jgi:hypothetical protein